MCPRAQFTTARCQTLVFELDIPLCGSTENTNVRRATQKVDAMVVVFPAEVVDLRLHARALAGSELIAHAECRLNRVESLAVEADQIVQIAIACIQINEELLTHVIFGAETRIAGHTVAVSKHHR